LRQNFLILFLALLLASCSGFYKETAGRGKKRAMKVAPSGKFRNPTLFSRINPFQGAAKARLNKSKRRKIKFFKKKRRQNGTFRKARKPGRTFDMKRSVARGRLKSSGSRIKSGGGSQKRSKNLFNTKKK
jgi:hypothetical protein